MNAQAPALHGNISNDAEVDINGCAPYIVNVNIRGTTPILFHAWSCEAVEEKAKAKKGSEQKKSDNVESYVYRNSEGIICLPGEYLRGSMIDPRNGAAKYISDERSKRKSGLDLFRAGIVCMTDLAPIRSVNGNFAHEWDALDKRRVTVQRAGITRTRPMMLAGWTCEVSFQVITPEYISPALLKETLDNAGRLCGVGDFRPTFGRFSVDRFDVEK